MLTLTLLIYNYFLKDPCRYQKYYTKEDMYVKCTGNIIQYVSIWNMCYRLLFDNTSTGTLYFTWRGNRYEPGDSILITDIRLHEGDAGPGNSLVCVTTDVNTQCCTDVGGVGEWLFPNGSMVIRNNDDPNRNSPIIRTGRTNQVRLNFRTEQTSPTGEYTCVVPETGGSVIQTAKISLVTGTFFCGTFICVYFNE